jgi:hypothetical protein
MNKQIKKYFDWKFDDCEVGGKPYGEDNGVEWFGVWDKDFLLVGCPAENEGLGLFSWYSNGPHFQGGPELFDISQHEFNSEMREYLERKYPEVTISNII